MRVEFFVFLCCLAASFSAEIRNTLANVEATQTVENENYESARPLTRKARLIGLGGIGGVGIVGGIGIVGGGVKGIGIGGPG